MATKKWPSVTITGITMTLGSVTKAYTFTNPITTYGLDKRLYCHSSSDGNLLLITINTSPSDELEPQKIAASAVVYVNYNGAPSPPEPWPVGMAYDGTPLDFALMVTDDPAIPGTMIGILKITQANAKPKVDPKKDAYVSYVLVQDAANPGFYAVGWVGNDVDVRYFARITGATVIEPPPPGGSGGGGIGGPLGIELP